VCLDSVVGDGIYALGVMRVYLFTGNMEAEERKQYALQEEKKRRQKNQTRQEILKSPCSIAKNGDFNKFQLDKNLSGISTKMQKKIIRIISRCIKQLAIRSPDHVQSNRTEFIGNGYYFSLLLLLCMDVESNPGPETSEEQTSLHQAAASNEVDLLRTLLLQPGVDVDVRTPLGQSSLHLAAKNGNVEPTRLLLIRGADPNLSDNHAFNSLHMAVDSPDIGPSRRQVVELLCMMGAELNAKTSEGETALSLSLKNSNLDFFKLLLEKSADYRAVNSKNWTLLHIAAEKNVCEALPILEHKDSSCLKQMSEMTTLDTGMTPLHVAAQYGRLEIVKELVGRNLFSIQIKDILDRSPLHVSVSERHLPVAEFLIDRGWDINERASEGNTCLHLAVRNNDLDTVKLLLAKGAIANVSDTRRSTPLQIASSKNFYQIAELLQTLSQQPIGNHLSTDSAGPSAIGNSVSQEPMILESSAIVWADKAKKQFLVHGHLNNLKLNLALHRFFTFPADYDRRSGMKRLDLAHSGFFFAFDYQSIQCFFCSFEITTLQGWKGLTLEQMNLKHSDESVQRFGQMCPLIAGEDVRDVPIVNPTNYNYEAHRLFSLLERRWTNRNVSVYDLAQKGFYFTGQDDNCRCWFCKLEVRGWEPGDTATGEHMRWNPKCSLLQPNAHTDNVPIGQELVSDGGDDCASNPFVKTDMSKCEYKKEVTELIVSELFFLT